MRIALFAAALAALIPARAAQDDPRLNELFAALAGATDPAIATPIEEEITQIWTESESPTTALLYMRSMVTVEAGDNDLALQLLNAMTELNPDFAEGFHLRAVVHAQQEDFAAAINDLERTLALEPRHFSALMALGVIMQANGEDKAALAAYEAALKINPSIEHARTQSDILRRKIKGQPI